MTKPTIVAVHGAWHSPEGWQPLTKVLQSHGYVVRAVALPSVVDEGTEPPQDPRDDIVAVRKVVEEVLDGGSNVLVVPHSYGAIPTTSAVRGLDTRSRTAVGKTTSVVGLAPISAFVLAEGKDILTGQDAPAGEPVDMHETRGPLNFPKPEYDAPNKFYADLPKEDADKWVAKLRPMLRTALWTLKSEYSAHKDIPIHYLVCTEDTAFPAAGQRALIKKMQEDGADVRVEEVKSSHSPFLSMPERTSDFIRRSAGENLPE
jgi:pimeloyl-ACP methyl ester carboxylesterase